MTQSDEIGRAQFGAQFATPDAILDWVRMGDSEWCHRVGLGKFYQMLAVTTPNYESCTTFILTMRKWATTDQAAAPRVAFVGIADRAPVLWPQPALLINYLDLHDDEEDISSAPGEEFNRRIHRSFFVTRAEGLVSAIWCCSNSLALTDRVDKHVSKGCKEIIFAAHRGERIKWGKILVASFERELEYLRLNCNRGAHTRTPIGPLLTWFIAAYHAQMYNPFRAVGDPEPNPSKRPRIMTARTPDAPKGSASKVESQLGDLDTDQAMSTLQGTQSGHRTWDLTIPEFLKHRAEVRGHGDCSAARTTELEATLAQLEAELRSSQAEQTRRVIKARQDVVLVAGKLVAAMERIEELQSRTARNEACLGNARCVQARLTGKINSLEVQVLEFRQELRHQALARETSSVNVIVVQRQEIRQGIIDLD